MFCLKTSKDEDKSDSTVEDEKEWPKHKSVKSNTRKRKHAKVRTWINRIISDTEGEDSTQTKTKLSQKSCWTSQEIQSLEKAFCHLLKQGIYPSGKQIQAGMSQYTCLQK